MKGAGERRFVPSHWGAVSPNRRLQPNGFVKNYTIRIICYMMSILGLMFERGQATNHPRSRSPLTITAQLFLQHVEPSHFFEYTCSEQYNVICALVKQQQCCSHTNSHRQGSQGQPPLEMCRVKTLSDCAQLGNQLWRRISSHDILLLLLR
jgi:hypothetical protein